MDDATKAQCGLAPDEEPASNGSSFVEQCRSGALTAADGCSSADTPEDDGPGSLYTNPESPLYQQYREETGYPYPESQYDSLYGYQQCGAACGKPPTSGETQRQYGCEQGYITEGC